MSASGLRRAGMIDMEANTTLVQQFPAHEAVPESAAPSPAVVLLHDERGLTAEIRALANRLAREGFFALAPNLYAHPFSAAAGAPPWMAYPMAVAAEEGWSGFPVRDSLRVEEAEDAKALASGLSAARLRELVGRALGHLALAADADPARVALLGFGPGGRIAFRAACEAGGRIRALAVWSGSGIAARFALRPAEPMPILEYESLRCRTLFLYGAADRDASPEEREAIDRVLSSAGVPHEIVVYPEAGRAFYDQSSPEFRIAASRGAWEKTVGFLRETIGPPAGARPG